MYQGKWKTVLTRFLLRQHLFDSGEHKGPLTGEQFSKLIDAEGGFDKFRKKAERMRDSLMPYEIKKMGSGYTVVSPNHPEGHSKKPMTRKNAEAQMRIMQESESGSNKVKAWRTQKNGRPE